MDYATRIGRYRGGREGEGSQREIKNLFTVSIGHMSRVVRIKNTKAKEISVRINESSSFAMDEQRKYTRVITKIKLETIKRFTYESWRFVIHKMEIITVMRTSTRIYRIFFSFSFYSEKVYLTTFIFKCIPLATSAYETSRKIIWS